MTLIFVCNLLAGATFAQVDEADLAREQRLFNVYEKYHSQETPDDVWQSVVDKVDANTQSYVVQSGDTLWSISQTLFGDPNFWPKIWSLNPGEIENPHQIQVSMNIVFRAGTTDVAPEVAVAPEGGETPAAETEAVAEVKKPVLRLEDTPVPESTKNVVPLANLPPSLPEWMYAQAAEEAGPQTFESSSPKVADEPAAIMNYYISEQKVEPVGKVIEVEAGGHSAATYQYILVKFDNAPEAKSYAVVKNMGELEDPNGDHKAHFIEAQGEIEILNKVRKEEYVYRALVRDVANLVQVESDLIKGSLPRFRVEKSSSSSQAVAQIIGGEFSKKREIFGPYSVVFLNAGKDKGVSPGQTLPVYNNILARKDKSEEEINPRQIGEVTVVSVTSNFATAVVTGQTEEIRVGDRTTSKE